MIDYRLLVHAILEDYAMPPGGTHGVAHWARVMENGLRLARATGADEEVVRLFAVLHDCRRVNEEIDDDHGLRAAECAAALRGDLFDLPDDDFQLLYDACAGHTDGRTDGQITVRTCWDADRLDLGRVGILPEADRLCTDAARDPQMIRWANERASCRVTPTLVRQDWSIDLTT